MTTVAALPSPQVESFFHAPTNTFTHVVYDQRGGHAAIIDPVMDFDPASGRTSYTSVQAVIDFIADQQLTLQWILETHAHADHLSSAGYLHDRYGAPVAIGAGIVAVQQRFKALFGLGDEFIADGRMPAVRESIRRSKAVDHLVENAKVTEVDETAKDAE